MKKVLIGAAATTMMALAPMATTFAWSHTESVKATCDSITGEFKNTDNYKMTVQMETRYGISDSQVVRKGKTATFVVKVTPDASGSVPAGSVTFHETAPNDESDMKDYDAVTGCTTTSPPSNPNPPTPQQPPVTTTTPPEETGRGGDTPVATEQVATKPTGSVNAGSAAVAPVGIVTGLGALVAGLGLGLRRLTRSVR